MGTNVQLSSPVCFDKNNLTSAGVSFVPRPSSNHLILSDSGIHLDLFHEDDGDVANLNTYSFIERKDGISIPPMSPSYNDVGDEVIRKDRSSSSPSLEKLGLSEKQAESSMISPDFSGKSGMVHRSKGRPAKLSGTGVGSCSNSRSIIQCPICCKNFNNSSALAKHKLIHSEERKYSCSVCLKAFKRQDHLNGHMMTHSSKKPYECKYLNCDKSYCDQRSLRRHIENHHQHYLDITPPTSGQTPVNSGDNVFQFDGGFLSNFCGRGIDAVCGNILASPVSSVGVSPSPVSQKATWPFGYNPLDEPKPVKCVVCDRRFKNLPALNGHMRLHGGSVKKDMLPALEQKCEDSAIETSKTVGDNVKDPNLQQSFNSEWDLSTTNGISSASKLFRVKQEDVTSDEIGENISDYSDYLLSSGGVLQKTEQDYGNNFDDIQSSKSDMLPAMEDLHLKDSVECQFSIEETQRLLKGTLSGESNFSDDHSKFSGIPQSSSFGGNKYGMADGHLAGFSSHLGDSKLTGMAESRRLEIDQQTVSLSKYRMFGSSGNILADHNNPSAASGAGNLCALSSPADGKLRQNFMGSKTRRSTTRPLTPSYAIQRSYGSVLPCAAASNVLCDSSAQRTPLSPFAGRAVYPASHNQSQSSVNSTIFEFPPTCSPLDSGILGHTTTPIHSSYGLAQRLTPHTPLSPYTPQPNAPYTPKNSASSSRLSRFQFPPSASGLKESGTCESPYHQLHQKSAYHPYHHHNSSLPSPRYTQLQHHHHHQQQQLKSDNFEHDVIQMSKEIEQHLQQLIEEENKTNALQMDQSFNVQQHDSDLFRHQTVLCESEKKLQLGTARRLGSGQFGVQEALVDNHDLNVISSLSFGKFPNQQRAFVDEKLDRERSEFDMELELDPLNILNLGNAGNVLDKKSRFSEASIDQTIGDLSHLDVIDMFILEGQYGDVTNEMALDEISNVDILSGHDELLKASHNDVMSSKALTGSGAVVGDQCVQQPVPKWMSQENLPLYDVGSNVGKEELFLNPNQLDSFKKKKHRPDPIIIPPCVNNFQTITGLHYSPNVASCTRKTSLPPSYPPPPYTALPVNGPVKGNQGLFQMPFDVRTPQSAPTFRFVEDGLMPEHGDRMIRQEKPMFSWDQNAVNSLTDTEIHHFPASSCYSLISDGVNVDDRVVQRLSLRSSQDDLGQFGATIGTELDHQEHGIWKTDDY